MDVDKMFKLPALPASAGQKRKFTDAPHPGGSRCLSDNSSYYPFCMRSEAAKVADQESHRCSEEVQSCGRGHASPNTTNEQWQGEKSSCDCCE